VSLYKTSFESFFRKKSIDAIHRELKYLVKNWSAEYVYFTSDTFMAMSNSEFDQFVEMYKSEFHLPFWIQSRPETINKDKAQKLKEAGCHRISLGLEHGNADFRKKILKKEFDNKKMIEASKVLAEVNIPLTVNNMIGFPGETRELIFDTIELNQQLTVDTTNCSVFSPFHGTPLQKLCVEKGYIDNDFIFGSINVDAPLNMPQLSREEIKSLRRVFALYARMPKKYWPRIKQAEKFDDEGDKAFSELREIYQQKYF